MIVAFSNPRRGWGGSAGVLRTMGRGLSSRGHEIIYLTRPGSPVTTVAREDGHRVGAMLRGYDFPLPAIVSAAWFLRRHGVDVMLSTPQKDLRLGGLAGRVAGVPVVAMGVTRPSTGGIDSRLWRWVPDHIVANSLHTRRCFLELQGIEPEDVSLIYNGRDLEPFARSDPANLGVAPHGVVVTFVGRIDPEKGIRHLIDAWPRIRAEVAKVRLVIAGSGGLEERLRNRTADDASVSWLGFRNDVPAILAASDVVVVPSTEESFGLVALEAMASGVPVVGTRAGGLPEVVRHGQEGLLVPPCDPRALAEAVITLAGDSRARHRLGSAGRRRADRFSALHMIDAYEETLREVSRMRSR